MNLSNTKLQRDLCKIYRDLADEVSILEFSAPVFHVYNPLDYAREGFEEYLGYCRAEVDFFLLGMNPGPWGMVQNGIPFGDTSMVRDWLKIDSKPARPEHEHPKRPILGFDCPRPEISGRRLWGWARDEYKNPENFFARFFVGNYCPLAFLEKEGRNRTPDKLKAAEREKLFALCDKASARAVELIRPKMVLGIGRFAEKRAGTACRESKIKIGGLPHPSPASPKANQGWARLAKEKIREYEKSL